MEPERLWRTRILLETALDYLPTTGRASVQSLSGPAPSRSSPCGVCHGKRYVLQAKRRRLCPGCDGHGTRRRRAGEPYYDEYTGEQVAAGDEQAATRSMTQAELSASLARIERDQAEREGRIAPRDELPWLRKKEAMYRLGDYEAALGALDSVAEHAPREARAILHHLVYGWEAPTVQLDEMLKRGVALVASLMPNEIRVPPWYLPDPQAAKNSNWRGRTVRHLEARGIRNEQIRLRHAGGERISALAREYNLTRRHVQRVVREAA